MRVGRSGKVERYTEETSRVGRGRGAPDESGKGKDGGRVGGERDSDGVRGVALECNEFAREGFDRRWRDHIEADNVAL